MDVESAIVKRGLNAALKPEIVNDKNFYKSETN